MSRRVCGTRKLVRRAGVGLVTLSFVGACSSGRPGFGDSTDQGPDAASSAVDDETNDTGGSGPQDASKPELDASSNGGTTPTTPAEPSETPPDSGPDSPSATDSDPGASGDAATGNTSTSDDDTDDVTAPVTDSGPADDTSSDDIDTDEVSGPVEDAGPVDDTSSDDTSATDDTEGTPSDTDAGGAPPDLGCDEHEDCDGSLLCSADGECVECLTEGEERVGTTACGLNDAGLVQQECVAGFWVDSAECVDPDECENGTMTTCEAEFDSLGACAPRIVTCTDGTYDPAACDGATELCNADGLDEDCDGEVNEAPCESYAQLASADGHVCAVTSLDRVLCWGSNTFGQVGSASVDATTTPTAVFGMIDVRSVAVSNTNSCAVFNDDSARCWGSNDNGELGDGTTNSPGLGAIVVVDVVSDIRQMLPGRNRSCAVLTNGTVECWADDPNPTVTTTIGNLSNVVAGDVAPEGGRFCALIQGGTVRCWDTFDDTAVNITGVTGATQVGVGDIEACARLSNGSVSCWTATTATDKGLTSVVHVDSGRDESCAVREDGSVSCWGDFYGSTPVQIDGISNATSVSVGFSYACVTNSDATAACFGKNINGQLGNPDTQCCSLDVLDTRFPPVTVAGP